MDDITALVKGRKRSGGKEKKGLNLSVTENDKEGRSKMIASCGLLENELSHCCKKEGVVGVDIRTRVKRL